METEGYKSKRNWKQVTNVAVIGTHCYQFRPLSLFARRATIRSERSDSKSTFVTKHSTIYLHLHSTSTQLRLHLFGTIQIRSTGTHNRVCWQKNCSYTVFYPRCHHRPIENAKAPTTEVYTRYTDSARQRARGKRETGSRTSRSYFPGSCS